MTQTHRSAIAQINAKPILKQTTHATMQYPYNNQHWFGIPITTINYGYGIPILIQLLFHIQLVYYRTIYSYSTIHLLLLDYRLEGQQLS